MRRIEIGLDALELLAECVSDLIGTDEGDARVLLVGDSTQITRGGGDLKELVWRTLSGRYESAERVTIGVGDPDLHADDEALEEAEAAVTGADCVVVVGSGTITDICKVAIYRAETSLPLVVVQTAASVDGFSDDVSVVLKSGVKRTISSRWPEVLLADMSTIVEAPVSMTAAGYGDAISMYTAPADWRLASIVGLDDSYHHAPVSMLLEGGPDVIGAAEGVGKREPEAMERLVRILALRGIASGVSGSTAILSGAEHVVSHMLDMHAGQTGTPTGVEPATGLPEDHESHEEHRKRRVLASRNPRLPMKIVTQKVCVYDADVRRANTCTRTLGKGNCTPIRERRKDAHMQT